MRGIYLSLSLRLLINLESLNMAESVGNITKHRRAPVVVRTDGGFRVIYVPVISGMSLAHHYQLLLARAAHEAGLNVTRMSLEGYFLKFTSDDVISSYYPEVKGKVNKNDLCGTERVIVESDVVADVGGFLYTDGPVKRTSRFSFSYMMPALDSIKAAAIQPQLHTRYTPKPERGEQALIYIDNASALYTLSFILEASEVSVLNVCRALNKKPDDLGIDERIKRVRAAIEALALMLGNMAYGARRSRSLPHWSIESIVAVVSNSIAPFTPTPGHSRTYLIETVKRFKIQKDLIRGFDGEIHYYNSESIDEPNNIGGVKLTKHESLEDVIKSVSEWLLSKLSGEMGK